MSFSKKINQTGTAVISTIREISEKLKETGARQIAVTLAEVSKEIAEFIAKECNISDTGTTSSVITGNPEKTTGRGEQLAPKCAIPVTIVFSSDESEDTQNLCRARYAILRRVGVTIKITGDDIQLRKVYETALKLSPERLGLISTSKDDQKDIYPPKYVAIHMDEKTWNKLCKTENINIVHPEIEALMQAKTQASFHKTTPIKFTPKNQYSIN